MARQSDGKVVLVTGAAGFIGAAIVATLVRDGVAVRAGLRHQRLPVSTAEENLTTCRCDLDNEKQVMMATAGASAVVHAAYGSDRAMAQQCRTLLAAMEKQEVPFLIFLSSISVYGERDGTIDETMAPAGKLSAYGEAKWACEALVRAWVGADTTGERRAVILRPGIVYGPRSKFWIDKMAERIGSKAWGTFGTAGDGIAALVHIDDLVALIGVTLRSLETGQAKDWPNPAVFNVVGPERVTWNDYFEALAAALHAPPLPRLNPAAITLRQACAIPAKLWRRAGLPGGQRAALAAMPGEIALFSRRAIYSMDAAAHLAGFVPRIGLAEGLRRSLPPLADGTGMRVQ